MKTSKSKIILHWGIRDLIRENKQTILSILCIMTGVAGIIGMQNLGIMIDSALSVNLQETHVSDIQIDPEAPKNADENTLLLADSSNIPSKASSVTTINMDTATAVGFSEEGVRNIENWFHLHYPGSVTTYRKKILGQNHGPSPLVLSNPNSAKQQPFVESFFIEPEKYPLYGTSRTIDGKTISRSIQNNNDIILNESLARILEAEIGTSIKMSYCDMIFTVTGIVRDEAESGFENLFSQTFGFFYADIEAAKYFKDITPTADLVYIRLANPEKLVSANNKFQAEYPFLSTRTTIDLAKENSQVTGIFLQLTIVLGLASLFLGGIGIMNTSRFLIEKRKNEIAVLKTLGIQKANIIGLFLFEGLMISLIGSLLGIPLGNALSFLLKNVSDVFSTSDISFSVILQTMGSALMAALFITWFFTFLPLLSIISATPKQILRNEKIQQNKGQKKVLIAAVLLLVFVFGFMYQHFFSSLVFAFLCIASIFIIALIVFGILQIILGLFKLFPSKFKVPQFTLAKRFIMNEKKRSSATALSFASSIFILSLLSILTISTLQQVKSTMSNEAGANTIIWFAHNSADKTLNHVDLAKERLDDFPYIDSYTIVKKYDLKLESVYDTSENEVIPFEGLVDNLANSSGKNTTEASYLLSHAINKIDGRQLPGNIPNTLKLYKGRHLSAEDTHQNTIVITANRYTLEAGLDIGDILTYGKEEGSEKIKFQIVGMVDKRNSVVNIGVINPNYISIDSISGTNGFYPENIGAGMNLNPEHINELTELFSDLSGVFIMPINSLNKLIASITARFTQLPVFISLVAMIIGCIVIANTVALSTHQRKRETAVLKAIGLSRNNIMQIALIEYGLLGIISGLAGAGLGALLTRISIFVLFTRMQIGLLPEIVALGFLVFCVIVSILVSLVGSWRAASIKPLRALRYE